MTQPTTARTRTRVATLVLLSLSLLPLAPSLTRTAAARDDGWSVAENACRINWTKSRWHLKQLIRCAEDRWSVEGGAAKAIQVARCESGLRPGATSSTGTYGGVFQQSRHYWRGRADRFGFDGWSVYNGRANVFVSIRMAHRDGWSHWGCA